MQMRPNAGTRFTRIAIVEDNRDLRESLQKMVEAGSGLQFACSFSNAEDAIRNLPKHTPDVVLMDIHLPFRSGIECTRILKDLCPDILATLTDTSTHVVRATLKDLFIGELRSLRLDPTRADGVVTSIDYIRVYVDPTQVGWDTNTVTTGAQGGRGTWNTTNPFFFDGFSGTNKAWPIVLANSTNHDAIFGASAGTVTVDAGGITANDLRFLTSGYTLMEYTAHRMAQPGVTPAIHWIYGNEIDAHWFWHNLGLISASGFRDYFAVEFRQAALVLAKYHPEFRVLLSHTHHWLSQGGNASQSMPSKTLIDELNTKWKSEGNFAWDVASHPYPQSLFQPAFWNETQATLDFETTKITYKNLEVLPVYFQRPELLFNGKQRAVSLTEQGFHTAANETGQAVQAAAYAYHWHRFKRIPGIQTDILHRFADNANEGGLLLGLVTLDHPEWDGQLIRRFRIDPTNVSSGSFEIDYILTGKRGDFDGDGVSDEDEGIATLRDTDGDGIPDFADPAIAGAVGAYESWLMAHPSLTGTSRHPDGDPDGDGLVNGVEFLMGSNPANAGDFARPESGLTPSGDFFITFPRDPSARFHAVFVEHGPEPGPSENRIPIPRGATTGPPVTVITQAGAADEITVTIPHSPGGRSFARIGIEIPFQP